MLDVRRMRVLREVAARGSISAAAQALGFSASAVSQQIATLEREVGIALVERGPSSIRLTEVGRTLARETEHMLAWLAGLEAEVRALAGLETGRLSLGAFATAGATIMSAAIATYSERYPGVELSFLEGDPEDCLPRLRSQDLDLVLTYEYDFVPLTGDEDLRRVPLLRDPIRLVIPENHPIAGEEVVSLADLRGESWIAEPRTDCRHFTSKVCAQAGLDVDVRYLSSDYRLSLALVAAGVAVALIPELALVAIPAGVAIRPIEGMSLVRRVDATHRADGERVPAVARMIETLRECASVYDGCVA
ncbi:MAG: LysR family transcriptional regulator [Solirubrobacterales bacterium]|nr:LysR family transcriptional regulator [Solirubrobacterales bacterium]